MINMYVVMEIHQCLSHYVDRVIQKQAIIESIGHSFSMNLFTYNMVGNATIHEKNIRTPNSHKKRFKFL